MTDVLDRFDRPLRDLRVSVTDRCSFRCTFCMPADREYEFLPRDEVLSFEETARIVSVFAGLGVRKVRLTGGEPLVRRELPKLVGLSSRIEGVEDLALTTNGVLLPRFADALAAAGLRRVTVSLHSLDQEVFGRMTGGRGKVEDVLAGIEAAAAAGLRPIKVNAVVKRGVNDDGLVDLARHFRGTGIVLRFIEYMEVGTLNDWRREAVVPAREIVDRIDGELPLEPMPRKRPSDPARRYRYLDGSGEIGIVASVTEPFCGACTRARLSAEGRVYTCLFGTDGFDLKTLLRDGASDEELRAAITGVWRERTDRFSEERFEGGSGESSRRDGRVEMFRVGG